MSASNLGTYSIASQHATMLVRTKEGHAAMGLQLAGDDHVWIQIQKKTFTNWVNEQLRAAGRHIVDLETGFADGLNLVALAEVLQQKDLSRGVAKRPTNDHHRLGNIGVALKALTDDGVKLVNIGNTDILQGNLKLILGLVWTLILQYQIGKSKNMFPPKKLMMTWVQEVIKECQVTNFTTDWNDGIALSALIDYCEPGLFANWRHLNRRERLANCGDAMLVSQREWGIPLVVSPEDFSSDYLDELSGMTYLSYYMKEGSPGYRATLQWVKQKVVDMHVTNFTTDWNDGRALCSLVIALGGNVVGYPNLNPNEGQYNNQLGIDAARKLGVEPVLSAKAMADPDVEHLGIMAYAARCQNAKPRMSMEERVGITGDGLKVAYVGKTAHFYLEFKEKDIDAKQVKAEVVGPTQPIRVNLSLTSHGGSATYIPMETGMHQVIVYCDNTVISGCPVSVRVHPNVEKVTCSGIDKCAVGITSEIELHENGAGKGNVWVEATSPSGKVTSCPVRDHGGHTYVAAFTPSESGEWKVTITYDGQQIRGSPFTCHVFDASNVKISGVNTSRFIHILPYQINIIVSCSCSNISHMYIFIIISLSSRLRYRFAALLIILCKKVQYK
ncbi:PREDICTED: filamin-C-like [Priapulus caudatus]|uniref:Filamin-C-like n=1 Tax=Priapulus caudatus TaxID=37621 RepID=A0ABM1E9P6_PRICU|nr:PREDICTED: filamin-C-like [Priapulus caudatus]